MKCSALYKKNKNSVACSMPFIDHHTHEVLAYHFGARKNGAFKSLQDKLGHFDINFYYTDDWGAYERHLIRKRNTQAIERKHLTLCKKIKRLGSVFLNL